MNIVDKLFIEDIFSSRIRAFQKLMKFRIRNILLVSSLYDYYLFEEDGQLYELIRQEYRVSNLSQAPELVHVTSGTEALELALLEDRYDVVIVTLHIDDMHPVKFTQMLRQAGMDIPVILLAYDNKEREELSRGYDDSIFDRVYIWQGDYRLLIAIFKSLEDKLNVENDTRAVGVQVIILVEDNVKFYSSYLPIIYREIFDQSQRLISEGINLTNKFLRLRARPKILLATNYEEAWSFFQKYKENVLGVITDVNFRCNGVKDPEAGIKLAMHIKSEQSDIPILMQSGNPEMAFVAAEMGVSFIHKGSRSLLRELRMFMLKNFGFGDFVFRLIDGREVGRAQNLHSFFEKIMSVPDESIFYHAERNHFSNWLKARTEFGLSFQLRPMKVTDFKSVSELRNLIIDSVKSYREMQSRGITTDFNKDTFDHKYGFARLGSGSLGGKARGLGFINSLLNCRQFGNSFPGVEIYVPAAIVLATDIFDKFMEDNGIEYSQLNNLTDEDILTRFLHNTRFHGDIVYKLRDFLEIMQEPLAVRSSSLLEDSQFQPFAGVYETFMIANNNPDFEARLRELLQSIKNVYASTFFKKARDYMQSTEYSLEEEKMAVIIQRLVGKRHNDRFYPDIAGVAKSYNFYPVAPQKAQDGVVYTGLGLGKIVVDGGNSVRFCPKYPKHLLQFYSAKETIRNSQQSFYALDLKEKFNLSEIVPPSNLVKEYDVASAEADGTLIHIASTYSPENDAVYDGLSRAGKRVVTFAPILKQKTFPLPEILMSLLSTGTWGMGTQVEIEFAVEMNDHPDKPPEFAMLQMRPLVICLDDEELHIEAYKKELLICESTRILGNGSINDIYDAVVVDFDRFDRGKSREAAIEISKFNEKLFISKRPYLLIGVGRWGSLDPWLGIPVTWEQISGARLIVESGFKDFDVQPSQGSHFFQNLTSFRVGYMTVNIADKTGFIDWEWLKEQPAEQKLQFTSHIVFEKPIKVKLNGHKGIGVIIKPD